MYDVGRKSISRLSKHGRHHFDTSLPYEVPALKRMAAELFVEDIDPKTPRIQEIRELEKAFDLFEELDRVSFLLHHCLGNSWAEEFIVIKPRGLQLCKEVRIPWKKSLKTYCAL